jgi:hypothetical protein
MALYKRITEQMPFAKTLNILHSIENPEHKEWCEKHYGKKVVKRKLEELVRKRYVYVDFLTGEYTLAGKGRRLETTHDLIGFTPGDIDESEAINDE